MSSFHPGRRDFLQLLSGSFGTAWVSANWPAIVSAAEHAHQAAKSSQPTLEVLTVEQAHELDALTACIIPTDDTPGAREAGVVYFIDRSLKTYAADSLPLYQKGLEAIQKFTAERFPGVARFSAASQEQQIQILTELSDQKDVRRTVTDRSASSETAGFLQTLRVATISGYLVDPSAGGNRDFVGWKTIGRDPAHTFSPPFGFYDKDYPGWQPAPAGTDKK